MTTYKKALGIGHCLVGLNGCSIYSAIEVTRCFTCNGFHHSSRNCKHKVICPRCSKNHDVHDCKEETLTCVNCVNLRAKENSENSELIAVDHAAWDYKNCRAHELVVDKLKKDFVTLSFSPNIPLQESLVAYKIPSFASAKTSARATPSRIFHLIRRIFTHVFSLLNLPCHVPLRTVSFE
jgi:hypothetical protein